MQITLHIGAHCTDEDALLKSLLKNKAALESDGIHVPTPGKYRQILRETLQSMASGSIPAHSRATLLEHIIGHADCKRLVMSNRNFICVPNRIFEGGELYALADAKLAAFGGLFAEDEIEIQLGIRDPGTFIPAAYAMSSGQSFESFVNGIDPDALYWSDLVDRIREILPDAKITVWCNEDTPLIWPKILRKMAGVDGKKKMLGGYDLIASILTLEGVQKLQTYLKMRPPQSETQRQKILIAFMERFGKDDALEDEVDIPEWTEDLMEDLTDGYDEDVESLAQRDDVTLIEPVIA